MPPRVITSRVVVQEPLPDLGLTTSQSKSNAIHDVKFVGALEPWPAFETAVRLAFDLHDWGRHRAQLELRPTGQPSPASLLREHTVVGHEVGVDGRWKEHIGKKMGAVFVDQLHPPAIGLLFGDFKASTTAYNKEPDVACMDTATGTARFIGELKVPWVKEHELSTAIGSLNGGDPSPLREMLGQVAEYMKDLDLTYGFMSTYNETVFLRQHRDPIRGWSLQYSDAVLHTTSASAQGASVRRCMWFLAQQVQGGGYIAGNTLPKGQWVRGARPLIYPRQP